MLYISPKIILIFFPLFLFSNQSEEDSKDLSLFFNKDNILTSIDNTETMRNLQYNKIYIKTKISSPYQNLKFYLRFNEYITYITKNNYNKDDSTSYQFTRKKNNGENSEFTPLEFKTDTLKSGYESKEIINIEDNIIEDFYFILVEKLNTDSNDFSQPVIGLNLIENNIRPALLSTNILEQFKNHNFINKRIFSVFYFNQINSEKKRNENADSDGIIIFGKLPHELKGNKKYSEILQKYNFNDNNLNWAHSQAEQYHIKWKLKFDSIICVDEKMEDLTTELVIEQNFFTGTPRFKEVIHNYFFSDFISKKICKEEKFYNYRENFEYYFYSCDNSIKSYFDKYNKDIIVFKSKELNEIFCFKLNELFFQYNNRQYFGVIFDQYQMHGWKLGRIFFEKYPLVFSADNKAIGYYNQKINSFDINTKINAKLTIILSMLIFILLIVLFVGFRKYNILKRLIPRKLKANELNDEFSYGQIEDNKKEITTEMATKISNNTLSSLGY